MTVVANCRDIFFPVPFPPSPFGFRRLTCPRPPICLGALAFCCKAAFLPQTSPCPSFPVFFFFFVEGKQELGESLRGNRIGATGLRASERKSASERVPERVSEREGFQRFLRGFERFLEFLRGFERFSEVFRGFQSFLRGFQRSSQRPSQRQISSQRLSVLLPLVVLPLELTPKNNLQKSKDFCNTYLTLEIIGKKGQRTIKQGDPCKRDVLYALRTLFAWFLRCKLTLRRPKLILPEAKLARNYGTEVTQISRKNYGAQNKMIPRQFL